MSLSAKLVLVAVVAVVLVQTADGVRQYLREEKLFEEDLARDLEGLGQSVASATEIAWVEEGRDAAQLTFDAVKRSAPRFDLNFLSPADVEPSQRAVLEAGNTVTFGIVRPKRDEKLVTVLVPVRDDGLVAVISAEEKLVDQRAYLDGSVLTIALSTGITALALALVLAFSITRFVERPLARLMSATQRIGAGDLATPVVLDASPDLRELATTLDDMRVSLGDARSRVVDETRGRLEAEVRADVERRQREELAVQLRHADRLATLGTLAGSVIHEVGAPLQVIHGRARMLEQKQGLPPVALEYAGIIREQADRIVTLTRTLLDFARRGGEPAEAVKLDSVINKALVLLGPVARHAKVDVVVDESTADVIIPCPEQELWQVLTNLATNAIHAMPSGGRLSLSAAHEAERVVISIADTGTGMSDEVKARIFSPFFTTKPPGQGTGLGLSVVDGIVRARGGVIDVESALGCGTTFRLRFPEPPREV